METKTITDNTPVAMLTVKQLKDYLFGDDGSDTPTSKQQPGQQPEKRYLYSVKQLATFLNVSYVTAWKLKKNILRPAVYQQGRVIMIDADMVLELMSNENNG